MSRASGGGPSLATLYSSMWLCDDAGDVYVLKNLDVYVDRYAANQQYKTYLTATETSPLLTNTHPATPPPTPAPDWIKVDGNFSSVAAGYEGLVCGLNTKSELYIRFGVNALLPEGTSWSKIICGAVQIAVGKNCIARKDERGNLFVANVRNEYDLSKTRSKNLVIDHWKTISLYSLEELVKQSTSGEYVPIKYEHLVLDVEDRLFIIAQTGLVYGCLNPLSEDDAGWIQVSQAPPIVCKPGFLQNIYTMYSYIRGKIKEDVFSQVCIGKGSLWCVAAENCELWQLVISNFPTSRGVCELRTNWSSVKIPTDNERAILVATSKSMVDGVYTVMVKNSNGQRVIVAFFLNQADNGRVEIDAPSQCDPKSLAIALNSVSSTASLYPKLPRTDDTDVCCENGDCEFCRNVQELYIPPVTLPSPYPHILPTEGGESSVSMLGKRPLSDSWLPEATSLAIGSSNGSLEHHGPKRRRVEHPYLARYCLLEGVEVQLNSKFKTDYPNLPSPIQLPEPSIFVNPIPKESIDAQYEYSFTLEKDILLNTDNYYSKMDY